MFGLATQLMSWWRWPMRCRTNNTPRRHPRSGLAQGRDNNTAGSGPAARAGDATTTPRGRRRRSVVGGTRPTAHELRVPGPGVAQPRAHPSPATLIDRGASVGMHSVSNLDIPRGGTRIGRRKTFKHVRDPHSSRSARDQPDTPAPPARSAHAPAPAPRRLPHDVAAAPGVARV